MLSRSCLGSVNCASSRQLVHVSAHRCSPIHALHTRCCPLRQCSAEASSSSSSTSWLQCLGRVAAPLLLTGLLATSGLCQPPAAAAAQGSKTVSALEEYLQLEEQGKLGSQRALDNIRSKYNIRRQVDGRVQLRSRGGKWFSVRLDLEVAGAMLLRDTDSGSVYAIETTDLPQVDLSDDYVLMMMFSDGAWEEQMAPVEFVDDDSGLTQQLTMSDREFREFIGLLKDFEDDAGAK